MTWGQLAEQIRNMSHEQKLMDAVFDCGDEILVVDKLAKINDADWCSDQMVGVLCEL